MTTENWEGFNGESENGAGRVGFYCIVGLIFLGFQAHLHLYFVEKKKAHLIINYEIKNFCSKKKSEFLFNFLKY